MKSPERGILEKRSVRTLFAGIAVFLGGLAILAAAFITFPYLREWRSPTPPRSPLLEAIPLLPLEPRSGAPTELEAANPPTLPAATSMAEQPGPRELPPPTAKPEPALAAPTARVAPDAERRSGEPPMPNAAAPVLSKEEFWVQVAAYKDSKYAVRLALQLSAEHYPVVIRLRESAAVPYVVWVGKYDSRERADEIRAALRTKGFDGFVLRDERRGLP